MSLRLNKAQRERLRAVASRLYREGDDHTMSGGFAVYSEGEAVEAACEDLEACLVLLHEVAEIPAMTPRAGGSLKDLGGSGAKTCTNRIARAVNAQCTVLLQFLSVGRDDLPDVARLGHRTTKNGVRHDSGD